MRSASLGRCEQTERIRADEIDRERLHRLPWIRRYGEAGIPGVAAHPGQVGGDHGGACSGGGAQRDGTRGQGTRQRALQAG